MNPSRRLALLPLLLVAVVLPADVVVADPIAYATGFGVAPGSHLLAWDLATGTATTIGPTGLAVEVRHLTLAPDGTLYGIDHDQLRLITIDPLTGQGTVVGPFDDPGPIEFLGLSADACGRLWATGYVFTGEPGTDVEYWLFRIDPATGNLERLATGDAYEIFSLAARGQQLYGQGVAGLLRVDLHDLSVHEIGGGNPGDIPRGLGFAPDGMLWGTSTIPPPPITVPPGFGQFTFTLDLATGERTPVTEHVPVPGSDFTIMPPTGSCLGGSPLEVPALGPPGLAALALLLALGALLTIRGHASAAY